MRGEGRAKRKRSRWAHVRAPLAVFLATLALVAQLLAPTSHRMAGPAGAAEVAAELKAAFGDLAVLCIQADESKSQGAPADRPHPCDDCCPLCQFAAAAHALDLPTSSGEPIRTEAAAERLAFYSDFVRRKPQRIAFAQPRAPPFEA